MQTDLLIRYMQFRGIPREMAERLAKAANASVGGGYSAFLIDAVRAFTLHQARMETHIAECDLARFSE